MRYFWIGTALFIACMICLGLVVNLFLEQTRIINDQRQKIANLKGVIARGNETIMKADSVIKANTIYVGPQIHDTIFVVKADTIIYLRGQTSNKFKHAR